ncbi:DUF2141 domain-containing protein [Muricauda oceani]|uniref:DUF2141 domain-containing protein n=1 Tax=Flagellimonas oceani TaxID=2698672 RepID=A0A6G7J6Z6_9FLAO|nr:DUF2141 domain-containing protein [Allomuricauda oceani]MBW8243061.1 DUF2141 domain-containing protein [Allomuricauda oceani]QII46586.1 DUF2141 domain-containing protein [Allomuricauda oceani]
MKIFIFLLFLPFFSLAQNILSIQVNNVPSDHGSVKVAVYDSDESFLSFDQVLRSDSVNADMGSVVLHISDLPSGEYALAIFHDENDNGKLDTNWLGIPKEKVAFSKAKMKTFGPPKFKECAFTMSSDHEIHIDL